MLGKPMLSGKLLSLLIAVAILGSVTSLLPGGSTKVVQAQSGCTTFPETAKTACGVFLQYWNTHGGLAQQGFPISGEMSERSDIDGKTYTVQYFERAVFERHPEFAPPNDVLLSLLGSILYRQKYPTGAPGQKVTPELKFRDFPETGKRVGGVFLQYWNTHGGLAQQGFPISEEFTEVSTVDGKPYKVQYFERAVFELHPEKVAPYNVLLSLLGAFRYKDKYQTPATPAPGQATSTPAPGQPTGTSVPGVTSVPIPSSTAVPSETPEPQPTTPRNTPTSPPVPTTPPNTPTPEPDCSGIPASVGASVDPECDEEGTTFVVTAGGFSFDPRDNITCTYRRPDGVTGTYGGVQQPDSSGTYRVDVNSGGCHECVDGIWEVDMTGDVSHHHAVAYFKVYRP